MINNRDFRWMKWIIAGAGIWSTCIRRQYMCILVDNHGHVIGTGYNGAPKGFVHCADGGCPRATGTSPHGAPYGDCIAVHAEANALLHSDYTNRAEGATLYVNGPPCWDCGKLIINAGITRVVYVSDPEYADWQRVEGLLEQAGIRVEALSPEDLA